MNTHLKIIFIFISCITGCNNFKNNPEKLQSKIANPAVFFYDNYKDEFLRSGLQHFEYNPRVHFEVYDTKPKFGVLIYKDSSINVRGFKEFHKLFNIKIKPSFNGEVHISKMTNGNLLLKSNESDIIMQIVEKAVFKENPIDYFIQLRGQIERFKIIAIKKSHVFNTIDFIFSRHDYLMYVPDSLKLTKDEKAQLDTIMKRGTKLGDNWYLYREEMDIDYL